MKHTLLILALLLLVTPSQAEPKIKKLTVVVNGLDAVAFKTRAENFTNVFRRISGVPFGVEAEETTLAALNGLEQTSFNRDDAMTDSFFHVLRVFYGYDNAAGKIKLIYMPDYAIKDGTDPSGLKYRFENGEPPFDGKTVCTLSGGAFVPVPWEGGPGQLFNDYISGEFMQVNGYGTPTAPTGTWRPASSARTAVERRDDDLGSQASTFSFQELNTFLSEGANVFITNIPEIADFHGLNTYKHAIAFSNTGAGAVVPDRLVANLGAMCPTVCGEVMLRVIPTCDDPAMLAAYFVPPPEDVMSSHEMFWHAFHDPVICAYAVAAAIIFMLIGAFVMNHFKKDKKLKV